MPQYVHSANAKSFSSDTVKDFLLKRGVAFSKSSPYHPTGNAQVERYVGVLWKSIRLALKFNNLAVSCGKLFCGSIAPMEALHLLLNTTTNANPHELFLNFTRRSPCRKSLLVWLCSRRPVMLRKFVRLYKNDDLVKEVQLLDTNSSYATIGSEVTPKICPWPMKNLL